jgi:hypothetical protein
MAKTIAKPPPPTSSPRDESNKPVHVIRYGAVRGSIWKSESGGKVTFTLTVDRIVVDKKAEHVTQVFESPDTRHLARVVSECAKWIEWQERYVAEQAARR